MCSQAITHVVALVRAADRKSPREAVDFILQLLKVNVSSTIHFHSIYITVGNICEFWFWNSDKL